MNSIIKEDLEKISGGGLDWEKFRNSTVLVSGAYGMLASYMVHELMYLNERFPGLNIRVISLCRNLQKARKIFSMYSENPVFSIKCCDVSEPFLIDADVNYIIHAASPASSQFYSTNPVGVIAPNVFGTKNLLELAREKKVNGFLFFSSGEVCGNINKEIISESDSGYLDPTDIRSCYGESKRMGENLCKCYFHQYGVPAISVRPEHTYGPTMDIANDNRVFAEFVACAAKGTDIVIKSDGLAVRNFCYISDATEGFFRALINGNPGESYNVGNNYNGRISIRGLAEMIVSLFPEKNMKIVYQKREDSSAYLENQSRIRPLLSTARLEKLGFKCSVDLTEGFRRTINSFIMEEI